MSAQFTWIGWLLDNIIVPNLRLTWDLCCMWHRGLRGPAAPGSPKWIIRPYCWSHTKPSTRGHIWSVGSAAKDERISLTCQTKVGLITLLLTTTQCAFTAITRQNVCGCSLCKKYRNKCHNRLETLVVN